jgi:hypothetical protein
MERHPTTVRDTRMPSLLFVDLAIAFDHSTGSVTVMGLEASAVEELPARQGGRIPSLSAALLAEPPRPAEVAWADSDDEYLRIVACQARSCRRCLPALPHDRGAGGGHS